MGLFAYLDPTKKRSKKRNKPLDLSALRVILSLDDKDFKELMMNNNNRITEELATMLWGSAKRIAERYGCTLDEAIELRVAATKIADIVELRRNK